MATALANAISGLPCNCLPSTYLYTHNPPYCHCPRQWLYSAARYNENGARNRPRLPSRELDRGVYDNAAEMTLMDPLYATVDSKLRRSLKCLARIESLAFMLFWKRASAPDGAINLIELPRLRLLLEERAGRLCVAPRVFAHSHARALTNSLALSLIQSCAHHIH
jgi:hypothetical protein